MQLLREDNIGMNECYCAVSLIEITWEIGLKRTEDRCEAKTSEVMKRRE